MIADNLAPDSNLQEECRLTEQLIELLKQEQAQLVKADIEGLIAVTEEKSRIVAEISVTTNRRYRALANAGFDAREGGMRAWLNASVGTTEVNRRWQKLLQLAQTVKNLNNTNGLLISKHMTRNQKALNVLQGNLGGNLYGPNGQSTSHVRPRGVIVG